MAGTTRSVWLTASDRKIARMALNWVLHETYSPEWRPQLTEQDRQSMTALLARLDAGRLSDSDLWYDFSGDALPLLRVAVSSFYRAIGPIPNEFEIITGLAPATAESLLARLV